MCLIKFEYCILLLLFSILGESCSNIKRTDYPVPVDVIDFNTLKISALSDLLDKELPEYIFLKNHNSKELFGRIDKVKMIDNRIYILDTRMRSLIVYDCFGNFIAQIGMHGQGPREYINLSDFDVDSNGTVYVLDGRANKLLVYNERYECIEEIYLSFEADILTTLNNDSLLWGLSSWNKQKGIGAKIALTDKKGQIGYTLLGYDEFIDPSYWISNYMFANTCHNLAYNQTIDNNVYLFSRNGTLEQIINIDFGKENVPDRDKIEIESKLQNYDKYCLIRKILAVTHEYIIGFVWQHQHTKLFIIDRNLKICYLSEIIADIDRRIGCGYSDEKVISYIDSENEELPDSVNKFVHNEGFVLKLQKIKLPIN